MYFLQFVFVHCVLNGTYDCFCRPLLRSFAYTMLWVPWDLEITCVWCLCVRRSRALEFKLFDKLSKGRQAELLKIC